MDSNVACPRCKTTKYRNPSLKLLVNLCGHSLCENCVELLFVRGTGNCLECGAILRRNNFRVQLFEDTAVEKEIDIRRRILRDFNKKEGDFDSLRSYNDYLEEVESIIFNLANDIDVEETKKKIDVYKRENKDIIMKNKSKLSKDEEYLEILLEHEREEMEFHRQQLQEEELLQKKEKVRNKEALIDELMFSDMPATYILATHKQTTEAKKQSEEAIPKEKPTHFSSGIQMGKRDMFIPVPKLEEGPRYEYTPLELYMLGPDLPEVTSLEKDGYISHIKPASQRDLSGGYRTSTGCHRALQDAFCGLYFMCDTVTPSPIPFGISMDTS